VLRPSSRHSLRRKRTRRHFVDGERRWIDDTFLLAHLQDVSRILISVECTRLPPLLTISFSNGAVIQDVTGRVSNSPPVQQS
jgi:hypothetical protein